MSNRAGVLLILCCFLVLAGNAPGQTAPRAAAVGPERPEAVESVPPHLANYQLSPGDVVTIKVFREPDLDSQLRLSKDGTVNFPLLGIIRLAGKTTNEAAIHVAGLLDKDYVHHPQVSVTITAYAKVPFSVLGQVTTPGTYAFPEEQSMDILGAIARAGGFTRLAEPKKVFVRRVVNNHEETFTVDVGRMMKDKTVSRFMVQPNDTISVPERFL